MRHDDLAGQPCSIARSMAVLGERWTLVILREAFMRARRFEDYQQGTGIARNILSDRLSKMVACGILTRSSDPSDKRRVIYSLTPKGEDLLPVVNALRQWGEEWGHGKIDVVLADTRDGKPVRKLCVQSHDGRALKLADLTWVERGDRDYATAAE